MEAKEKYEEEKENPGLKRIKALIDDEKDFGKIITWVRDAGICLRRGTEAKNACYALSDFGIKQEALFDHLYWFVLPYTKKEAKTNLW